MIVEKKQPILVKNKSFENLRNAVFDIIMLNDEYSRSDFRR